MTEDSASPALAGRTIAIPENREVQLFAQMLERHGARIISCPLIAIHDNPDSASVEKWLRTAIKRPFDDLILYTGEGVNRLADMARRLQLLDDFIASLQRSRKISRGPKPARALRALNVKPDLFADEPTTEGVIATLSTLDTNRRRVGVQLYGRDPNQRLMAFLDDAGVDFYPVAPYVYADRSEDRLVTEFIAQLTAGRADAIAFTSASQVERLVKVAHQHQQWATLQRTLQTMTVAAVGPLVIDALENANLRADLVPDRSFTLRPLVRGLCQALQS